MTCKYFNGNLALIPNLLSSPYDEPPLKFPRSANTNPDLRIDGHHKKKNQLRFGVPKWPVPQPNHSPVSVLGGSAREEPPRTPY